LAGFGIVIFLPLGLLAALVLFIGPMRRCTPLRLPVEPGLHALAIVSGGVERCSLLYVPASLDRSLPAPLVVNLHGFASNPRIQVATTGWNALADREGFVAVYPQGTSFPLRWNAIPGSTSRVDDVQFFNDLLAELDRTLSIDRQRVYVTGFSNGGGMTNRLACESANQITAAAAVSGVYVDLEGGCQPERPVPLIAFHGTADSIVPYAGGEINFMPLPRIFSRDTSPVLLTLAAEDWAADWAERNGCDTTPQALPLPGDLAAGAEGANPGDTHGIVYTGCREGADVIYYTIDGGGHTWPGSRSYGVGHYSLTNASELIWEFFQAHTPQAGPP